jgi:hypothetical protein
METNKTAAKIFFNYAAEVAPLAALCKLFLILVKATLRCCTTYLQSNRRQTARVSTVPPRNSRSKKRGRENVGKSNDFTLKSNEISISSKFVQLLKNICSNFEL